MYTARSDRLGKAVVGIVIVLGENLLPAMDQARRDRLRTDMHQTPAIQIVFGQIHIPAVNGIENVLRPGDQQPNDAALFVRNSLEDPFRADTAQKDRPAACKQRTEPVHLRARMVQRRNAKETVFAALAVVSLLRQAGMDKALVIMQDRFRETRRAGREINRRVIRILQFHRRTAAGAETHKLIIAVRKVRAAAAHKVILPDLVHLIAHRADSFRELRAKDQQRRIRQINAIPDLIRRISIVQGYRQRTRLQRAEINRQPLEAVHQKDRDLVALLDIIRHQQIGKTVRTTVKIFPGDLPAIRRFHRRFYQRKFAPAFGLASLFLGVNLHQRCLFPVQLGIPFKKLRNRHDAFPPYKTKRAGLSSRRACLLKPPSNRFFSPHRRTQVRTPLTFPVRADTYLYN